jgi:hypothetical protein
MNIKIFLEWAVRMVLILMKNKFNILYAKSSQKYQLFIPQWSNIKEPGKYQIVVTKDIQMSTQIRHCK